MSFKEFYALRMNALQCGQVNKAVSPSSAPQPTKACNTETTNLEPFYYKDRDIWRHYPNMYDFRQASSFNTPEPVLYPYTHPIPKRLKDSFGAQDFRRTALISKWQL